MGNGDIRRILLKPMARRRKRARDAKAVLTALSRLDDRTIGDVLVSQERDVISNRSLILHRNSWKDPVAAKKFIALVRALFHSRRLSRSEYVFYASSPVESIHEKRWFDDVYNELGPISERLNLIAKTHGLGRDEYWPIGKGPAEHEELNNQYSTILDKYLIKTFREFDLNDLADLREANETEYERLRERGRRAAFHSDEIAPAVRDIIIRYEEDARKAAIVNAYSAAVILLGAAIEGLLLLRCLRSKQKAIKIAKKLPQRLRPRHAADFITWKFETLISVCSEAGWLPPVSTPLADYKSEGLAHVLREMRNHVHPGRQARERPWSEMEERDYMDAHAIYIVLLSVVNPANS